MYSLPRGKNRSPACTIYVLAHAVSFCHGQNSGLGRRLKGNWIFRGIGSGRGFQQRKRRQPDFVLGTLGCMAQNHGADLLAQLPDVALMIGTQKFHQVSGYLDNLRSAREAGLAVG